MTHGTTYSFLNADEAQFVESAVQRLIPSDDFGPSGVDAHVNTFIDRRLADHAAAGRVGDDLGTIADIFRRAICGIERHVKLTYGRGFHELQAAEQDSYLASLESTALDLNGVPANAFFEILLTLATEGYFEDPGTQIALRRLN